MSNFYFLVPDADSAHAIVAELHALGLDDRSIGIVGDHEASFDARHRLEDFHEPRHSDFLPALEKGAASGGAIGLVLGIAAVAFPPAGIAIGGAALLLGPSLGASFGALMSGMVGASLPHQDIERYVGALERGQLLLIVETGDRDNGRRIRDAVLRHHPEVEIREGSFAIPGAL